MPRILHSDIAPPRIDRHAPVPTGATFWFGGRPLLVVRAYGEDAAAPTIVEELEPAPGGGLVGQLSLWSLDGVRRALKGGAS